MKGLVYPHFSMVGKDELISHMWSNRRHGLFSKIRKLVLWRLMICVFAVPNKTSSWTLLLYSYRHDFIPVFHWFSRRLSIIWKRIFWEKIVDATIAWSVPFKNGENNFKESIGWTKIWRTIAWNLLCGIACVKSAEDAWLLDVRGTSVHNDADLFSRHGWWLKMGSLYLILDRFFLEEQKWGAYSIQFLWGLASVFPMESICCSPFGIGVFSKLVLISLGFSASLFDLLADFLFNNLLARILSIVISMGRAAPPSKSDSRDFYFFD